jgi:hypothetical protein
MCNTLGICVVVMSCEAGTDCASCEDFASCAACNALAYPTGWEPFTALRSCVSCNACYTTCDGAAVPGFMGGSYCSGPPAKPDGCDVGTCAGCSTCATSAPDGGVGGTCLDAENACLGDKACTALLMAIAACPAPSLPMPDAGSDAEPADGSADAPAD